MFTLALQSSQVFSFLNGGVKWIKLWNFVACDLNSRPESNFRILNRRGEFVLSSVISLLRSPGLNISRSLNLSSPVTTISLVSSSYIKTSYLTLLDPCSTFMAMKRHNFPERCLLSLPFRPLLQEKAVQLSIINGPNLDQRVFHRISIQG